MSIFYFRKKEFRMPYFKYKNKSVYYEEIGQGEPVILIHGNTMSSKMFDCILDLYKSKFKEIS